MVLKEWTNEIDKNKQVAAIIPNIIHSLDASHLINLINYGKSVQFLDIVSIHDCFGSHPNNMLLLSQLVKIQFIKLYSECSFLDKYHNRFIDSIKDNNYTIEKDIEGKPYVRYELKNCFLPELPNLGNLNLEKIINSKHFIT